MRRRRSTDDPRIAWAVIEELRADNANHDPDDVMADVLLFNLAHPRWEFAFQPVYAAYLNLIEPWWKILKSLALKGRQFLTWEAVEQAVVEACGYRNAHRHPFIWDRRRRHRIPRKYGVACMPKATGI